jgi:hypothetical protein
MIPQLFYIGLIFTGLGVALAKNGKKREGKYNAFIFILAKGVIITILYYGGFFDPLL